MTNYSLNALVHVASLLLFQYTGDIWAMSVSFVFLGYNLLMYIIGVGALLSPELSVEIDEEEYELQADYGNRGILQVTILMVAYMLWQIGYPVIAGVLGLQAVTVLASCIISMHVVSQIENEEDEDK